MICSSYREYCLLTVGTDIAAQAISQKEFPASGSRSWASDCMCCGRGVIQQLDGLGNLVGTLHHAEEKLRVPWACMVHLIPTGLHGAAVLIAHGNVSSPARKYQENTSLTRIFMQEPSNG